MFRLIKIIFNATILVLAIIGFNTIGGQKYVDAVIKNVSSFIKDNVQESAKEVGDFSNVDKEFEIDNTFKLFGYKGILCAHKASGQRLVLLNTGNKTVLSQTDIQSKDIANKIKSAFEKTKYQAITIEEIKVTERGMITAKGKSVPYAKFDARVTKLPVKDYTGIIAALTTTNGNNELIVAVNESKRYSQLITREFFSKVKEIQ